MNRPRASRASARRSIAVAAVMVAAAMGPGTATAETADAGTAGLQVRALIEARQHAVLSSEIAGRVARLPLEAGQSFKAGQTLVGFDCASYQADLDVARAQLRAAEVTARLNRRLNSLKSIGEAEVELAEVKVDSARAEVRKVEVQVRRCEIKAPYDGRVVEVRVQEHESVPPGAALLEVLSDQDLKITLIVPSNWLVRLRPGQRFALRIDETGDVHQGEVAYIGAKVDPASQSVKVTARLETGNADLLSRLVAGMSGTASFPIQPDAGTADVR